MSAQKNWFSDWFNTTYYHKLYNHRNEEEAQNFMQNLVHFLKLPKSSSILDLACGKGRHSIFLNTLGYQVLGADLSENSIKHANEFANETLSFKVQDMRKDFNLKTDAVFNLFTSFGYFDNDSEDIKVLQNIKNALKPNGVAVIDYMNVNKVIKNLVKKETTYRDDLKFNIKRSLINGFITKDIHLTDQNKTYDFQEKVKAIDLAKFETYCTKANLKIKHTFGDYNLSNFNVEQSDRLILILSS